MKITDIVKTGHVNRFQIVRTQREQTIAEHMYQTAMIADLLAREIVPDWDDDTRNKLVWLCLIHDIPEVMSGDIPTPAKSHAKIHEGEQDVTREFWRDRVGRPKVEKIDPLMMDIMKLADLVEPILFLSIEAVDARAKEICTQMRLEVWDYIESAKMRFPELHSEWGEAESMLIEIFRTVSITGDY